METTVQEECRHCPHNPKAEKPLDKMKHVWVDRVTIAKIEETGKNPSCFMCELAREAIAQPKRADKRS